MKNTVKNIDKIVPSQYLLRTDDFLVFKLCADGLYRMYGEQEDAFQYSHFNFTTLVGMYCFVPISKDDVTHYLTMHEELLTSTVESITIIEDEEEQDLIIPEDIEPDENIIL